MAPPLTDAVQNARLHRISNLEGQVLNGIVSKEKDDPKGNSE